MTSLGPNSPCHCGSGRKYKKCCKRADAVAVAANRSPQSGYVPTGPTRHLRGSSLDRSHASYATFESLLALDAAAGNIFVVDRDLGSRELAPAAAELGAAVQACCEAAKNAACLSPSFEAAAEVAARTAAALAQNAESDDKEDFFDEYHAAVEALNLHINNLIADVLTNLGVDYVESPDFGLYWFSDARLSRRDGRPWLVVELTIRLYPAMYAPGGLFTGRAALGDHRVELDAGLRALLEHDEESDLDPEYFVRTILMAIADRVAREGQTIE